MAETDLLFELARFVERVGAVARTGLAFKATGFDAERYEELLHEAADIRAHLENAGAAAADNLKARWRAQVVSGYDGYVTAAVGCGAIVFNPNDEILMIQRPNGRWWYPTGFCDVGVSPAENAAKEVREETGLIVTPARLMAITDSLKLGSPARHIYSILFYCRLDGGEFKLHPLEALQAGFYPLDRLPEPLHLNTRAWISMAREFHFNGRIEAYFDPF
ncbi:MAG: NUDIX hydrolase N-terminal domain-containing protein [Candidatus Binataceae bacterium]